MLLGFAKWVMQKRFHAVAVAFVATLIPWLFWLGAAAVALCTMRKGITAAAPVVVAALVAAAFWMFKGDALPLCGVLITLSMALVLRARVRWIEALITGSLVAAVLVQSGLLVPPHALELMTELRQRSGEVDSLFANFAQQGLNADQLGSMVLGTIAGAVECAMSVAVIALARFWQSALYHPGAFRSEFHSLRLLPKELLIIIVIAFMGVLLGAPAIILVCWLPLLIAGIALVHGVLGIKRMNGLWLVGFYALLLTTWPVIFIVLLLAVSDCFAHFRERLASRKH